MLGYSALKAQNPLHFTNSYENKNGELKTAAAPEKKSFAAFQFLEPNDTHDFGTIPEGPKVTYAFTFINTGNEPLIISNAQASCGCTSPEYPKEPILPGKKGKISVTYTTEGHPGNFSKSVYLSSNAQTKSGAEMQELIITGIVIAKGK